jgi:hypothetical protein
VRLNGGGWSNATGTASWTRSVTLSPCFNTIEARSRDKAGNYSIIASNVVTYTPPNTVPNTPTNVSPPSGAAGVPVTPTLEASAFSDPDPVCLGDIHAASQWQVLSAGGRIVADSGTDTVNKVSWVVPPTNCTTAVTTNGMFDTGTAATVGAATRHRRASPTAAPSSARRCEARTRC